MANSIRIKRGVKSKLPTLNYGELALCYDTKQLFIGNSSTNNNNSLNNLEIITETVIDDRYALAQINTDKKNNSFNGKYLDKIAYFNSNGKLTSTIVTNDELNQLSTYRFVVAPTCSGVNGKTTIWFKTT